MSLRFERALAEARAYAYASDELREWWRSHPRVTFADFEAQWPYPDEAV